MNDYNMRIFLIGFMGSGKTSIGEKIAKKLNLQFIDIDDVIEKEQGLQISDIFAKKGEDYFRSLEKNALNRIIEKENVVIATGGGTPCFFDNMELMNKNGITVYLKLPAVDLFNRLENSQTDRPLLKGLNKEKLLAKIVELLNKREKFYMQAQHTIDGIDPDLNKLYQLCL